MSIPLTHDRGIHEQYCVVLDREPAAAWALHCQIVEAAKRRGVEHNTAHELAADAIFDMFSIDTRPMWLEM